MTGVERRTRRGIESILGAASLVLAGVFFAFVSTQLSVPEGGRAVGPLGAAVVAIGVVAAGSALRWPAAGVSVTAVAVGVYVARHYPNGPILAAGLLSAFLAARRADRLVAAAAVVLLEAAVVAGWLISGHDGQLAAFFGGWALAAAAVGDGLRSRRRWREEQLARAAEAERSLHVEAQQRAAEQRLDIARDLHDGVAHAMATINVQASAAARVLDARPDAARDALRAIAQASGTVLDELNALVTVLREGRAGPADLVPTPGLGELADLVAASSGAALRCELSVGVDAARVTSAVGTAAYRIVQESLTNVLRHSGASLATVSLVAESGDLVLQVRDDGARVGARVGAPVATPSPGAGTGIAGMHERARATGGELTAGAGADGFVVRARWPEAAP